MKTRYIPKGVCSRAMDIETDNGRIVKVTVTGGCAGNSAGLSKLVEGMEIKEVIKKLYGTRCGMKPTSCPDQLARALTEIEKRESSMEEYINNRDKWLASPLVDKATKDEISKITDDDELKMRFSAPLSFGTAGQRGVMGAGLGRLNVYTVKYTTRALSEIVKRAGEKACENGVVIAYDCRLNSKEFAEAAAAVLAENGIKVYLFDKLTPTPVLSYTIRKIGATAGINITASHNPVEYNGYKVYWSNGAQLPPDEAAEVAKTLGRIDIFEDCVTKPFDDYYKNGKIVLLGGEYEKSFCDEILSRRLTDEKSDITVVYTPLHGTGLRAVPCILEKTGVTVETVEAQMKPDGHFTTVPSPNPENPEAFGLALRTAQERGNAADLLIATDPDADRIGVMAKKNGGYAPLSGNQTGIILIWYILTRLKADGRLPANGGMISTIVSSPLAEKLAKAYGVSFVSTFTGFKFIAEQIDEWGSDKTFLFGFEESFGYMIGDYVRDKDSVGAAMMICDAAAALKREGKTLFDCLDAIYAEYGFCAEYTDNLMMRGIDGPEKTKRLMSALRGGLAELGGVKIVKTADYLSQTVTEADGSASPTGMEKSNVLKFTLADGSAVCVRPSGTEPKVKFYYLMTGKNAADCLEKTEKLRRAVSGLVG